MNHAQHDETVKHNEQFDLNMQRKHLQSRNSSPSASRSMDHP
jgi:hypothetical protein